MEESTTRNIIFFAALDASAYEQLSAVRGWTNLEMGREGRIIWLRKLNYEQINATPLLQIPFVKRYYAKKDRLFAYNQLLPERKIPRIAWQPIHKETALTLPNYNFNYFGSTEKVEVKLVTSEKEKPSAALLTTLPILTEYVSTAPAIRYQHLKWVLINYEEVFLLGTPLLPIQGKALWQKGDAFLPAGYDFEWPMLTTILTRKLVDAENRVVVWNETGNYFFINKKDLNFIDLAAVRNQKI